MKRAKGERGLNPTQKRLCERHSHLPAVAAARVSRLRPSDYDDVLSVANLEFIKLASIWQTGRSHDGEDGFGPFVVQWLPLWTWKTYQREKGREAARLSLDALTIEETLAAHEPLSCHAEAHEAWQALNRLPPQWQGVLAMRLRMGLTLKAVGKKLAIARQRVHLIEKKALARLREILGAADA